MADERESLRDWHRLFGLLLADFFTDSPFVVEVERDLSVQHQLLDVVIIRRTRGGSPAGCRTGWTACGSTTWSRSSPTARPWTAGP